MLLDWAIARGESPEIIGRAQSVMLQPNPGGVHDDHIHVRTSCSLEERVAGCETIGPQRPWLTYDLAPVEESDGDLALALLQPITDPHAALPSSRPPAPRRRARRARNRRRERLAGPRRRRSTSRRHVGRGSAQLAYLDPPFGDRRVLRRAGRAAAARGRRGPWRTRTAGPRSMRTSRGSSHASLRCATPSARTARCGFTSTTARCTRRRSRATGSSAARASLGEIVWVPATACAARGAARASRTRRSSSTRPAATSSGTPAIRACASPSPQRAWRCTSRRSTTTGRRYRERTIGRRTYRYYADEGRSLGSVWTDCPAMIANTPLRRETTGYPTQKPLKLLERIVRASSREGGLVVDPFCGSGTTLVAAAKLGRRFAGCDRGELAIETSARAARAPRASRSSCG